MYVIAPTCSAPVFCYGNALAAYEAKGPGIPAGFTQVDAADAPRASSASDAIGQSAIAIDGNDLIWVAWVDLANGGGVFVATFDTHANQWSSPTLLQLENYQFAQGGEGVSLALDAAGLPHIAWNFRDSADYVHVVYAHGLSGGGFTAPLQLDDYTLAAGHGALHPAIAFAPDGSLVVAWLDGFGSYDSNGTIHVRTRDPSGTWSASVEIPDQAETTVDNGPSLMVTSDGVRHVAFVNYTDTARYWYSADGITWHGDQQPPAQQTHDPSLGPDGSGGLYMYGHGTPEPTIEGTGLNLYRFHKPAGATAWGPFTQYVTGDYDCSISTRWAQFFQNYPATPDAVYWSPVAPDALYLWVN